MTFLEGWNRYFSAAKPNFVLRCILMLVGLACVGAGIALSKYSTVGVSPISCIPAVLTDFAQSRGIRFITLGMLTFAINFLFLVVEIALLRRAFKPAQLLQLAALLVMSWFIDFWMGLISSVPLPNYPTQLLCLVVSLFILAFGIACELKANVLMVPGDAVVHVIAYASRRPFSVCKVAFDSSLMLLAAVLSFALLGGLYGVREGSVLSAILVGVLVGMLGRVLRAVDSWLPDATGMAIPPVVPNVRGGT